MPSFNAFKANRNHSAEFAKNLSSKNLESNPSKFVRPPKNGHLHILLGFFEHLFGTKVLPPYEVKHSPVLTFLFNS